MEFVTCALCGSAKSKPLYTVPDYLLGRFWSRARFVQCLGCGLIYQNPRPTREEMAEHYPPEYEPYQFTGQMDSGGLISRAVRYGMDKRRRYVAELAPRGGRLLDIGCATGEFLHIMREQGGWDVYGVEPNLSAAQVARDRYGLSIFPGYLEDSPFPPKSFDVITMWDVFEHLHQPLEALHHIQRLLRAGGWLILRVPNYASWDAKLFGRYWAGLDAPRHLYVFSPATLTAILQKAGFDVLDHRTDIGRYPTFVLSLRFWLRGAGVPESWQRWVVRGLYSPLARLGSAPIFFVYGAGLRGPLLVTRARGGQTASAGV